MVLYAPASAGAWTPEKGRINAILSTTVSETPADDHAVTTDLYYEYGMGGGWTLVVAPSVSDQANVYARNEVQASIRRAFYQKNGWAISGQAGVYAWKEGATQVAANGTELRLALGKSFGDGGWINAETALRRCGGVDSMRWEGTVGHKVRSNDRAILKVFGDGEGCAASITRVQASYVYSITPRFGLELGWRQTLPNVGNWNERGAVIGLWTTF